MKHLISLSLFALLVAVGHSYGSSVGFSGVPGQRTVLKADGVTTLTSANANGDLVLVGTFATESFSFDPTKTIQQNFDTISASGAGGGGWSQFASSTGVSMNATGSIQGTDSDTSAAANPFNNQLIYVWVFDASTIAAATQMGIFRADNNSAPPPATPWLFGQNGTGTQDVILSTKPSVTPSVLAIGGAGTVLSGGAGNMELVAPTPEPSTLAALFGGAGLLAMIRRRATK